MAFCRRDLQQSPAVATATGRALTTQIRFASLPAGKESVPPASIIDLPPLVRVAARAKEQRRRALVVMVEWTCSTSNQLDQVVTLMCSLTLQYLMMSVFLILVSFSKFLINCTF